MLVQGANDEEISKAMVAYMRNDMKLAHRELHDAVLVAGIAVPPVPSFHSSGVPKLEVTGDLSRVGKAYERIAVLSTTQSLNMYSTIDEELGKSLCV